MTTVWTGRRGLWLFVLLCLLGASRWLLEATWPSTASSYQTECLGCVGAGLFALVPLLRTREKATALLQRARYWQRGLLGVAILTGPVVANSVAGRSIHGSNGSLAMALIPIVVATSVGAFGASGDDLPGRLWPGLTGVTGLLLLLPQPDLSVRYLLALSIMPLSAGLASAFLEMSLVNSADDHSSPKQSLWMGAALLAAAGIYGGCALQAGQTSFSFPWAGAVLDGLGAFLSLQVLQTLGAMRWGAQFLLIPLLTMVEGVVLLRPVLDLRSWLAFVLLGVSSAYLLWQQTEKAGRARSEPHLIL